MSTKKLSISLIKESSLNYGFVCKSDKYINNKTNLIFLHKLCGREFKKTWKEFCKYDSKCVLCNKDKLKDPTKSRTFKDSKIIQKEFESMNLLDYHIVDIDSYKSNKTKLTFNHTKCNKTFKMSWNDFQQGHRCTNCKGSKISSCRRKSVQDIEDTINKIPGLKYISSKFDGRKHIVTYKHTKCGNINNSVYQSILAKYSYCSFCKGSNFEKIIEAFLIEKNINFEREVKFINCKNKIPLRFDFKIKLSSDKFYLIECDGYQHYKPSFEEGKLEYTIKLDNIKDNFCNENKIVLLRIKYNHNIFSMLENIEICNEVVQRLSDEEHIGEYVLRLGIDIK